MGEGIDPVAMGTHYANAFMKVLSGVPVAQFGATSFSGSVLDFLTKGGSAAPTDRSAVYWKIKALPAQP